MEPMFDALQFARPELLFAFACVPAVVLLHWTRSRRAQRSVPTLMIWKRILPRTPARGLPQAWRCERIGRDSLSCCVQLLRAR